MAKPRLIDAFVNPEETTPVETICGLPVGREEAIQLDQMFATVGYQFYSKLLSAVQTNAIEGSLGSYDIEDDKLYQRAKARFLLAKELLILPDSIKPLMLQETAQGK